MYRDSQTEASSPSFLHLHKASSFLALYSARVNERGEKPLSCQSIITLLLCLGLSVTLSRTWISFASFVIRHSFFFSDELMFEIEESWQISSSSFKSFIDISNDHSQYVREASMGIGGGSIGWGQKLSFGTGHVLNDLCASVWFSYLLVYLQYVLLVR